LSQLFACIVEVPIVKQWSRFLLMLALVFIPGSFALAKGIIVAIVVTSPELAEPLRITDQQVLRQFSIYSGPDTRWRSNGGPWNTDYSGIFIDFPGGAVQAPEPGILVFDVEFYISFGTDQEPAELPFRIQYAMDPAVEGAYIFLPQGNPYVNHGVEGNWFRSTDSWEALIRPDIQRGL
jgi:hypothetical protein